MNDKQAIKVLIELQNKYPLTKEEHGAISNAIGILSWSTLGETRLKGLKARRDKRNE